MFLEKELKDLENKKNNLEKKDIDLIICDFDDTIFSRKQQLEESEILRNNRGNKGNDAIVNQIGLEKFIDTFYKDKDYPKDICSKLRENHDLILTAGFPEIQTKKIKETGLEKINLKIVLEAEEKIFETINYVVNNLGFIPSKITIYEDRPKHFIKHRKLIEDFLGTKLEIMFVEMDGNNNTPKIKKIED